jgi:hypothetical protein
MSEDNEGLTNELFIKDMRILWQNLDNSKRNKLGEIIRGYFPPIRASRIIQTMQIGDN